MQKEKNNLPSQKIAVLIDGGFFIKRFNSLYNKKGNMTPEDVAGAMYTMAHLHVGKNNVLYRIFYYDCKPLEKKFHNPITNKVIDFGKTKECLFRKKLFEELKKKRKVALRLGTVKDNGQWQIYSAKVKELLNGTIDIQSLKENDVYLNIRQKGIDMKIGVDIASLSLKRFVDTIVLFSGDADFVPAAKLARREGVDFILDPMNANVDPQLFEHIDGMKSVTPPGHKKRVKKS
jgi:uncharacterized LabA/DUF88 family protein